MLPIRKLYDPSFSYRTFHFVAGIIE